MPRLNFAAATPEEVAKAAAMNDINDAAKHLQDLIGITDGGVAGICLEEDIWANITKDSRIGMLNHWLEVERLYEKRA